MQPKSYFFSFSLYTHGKKYRRNRDVSVFSCIVTLFCTDSILCFQFWSVFAELKEPCMAAGRRYQSESANRRTAKKAF